MNHDDDGLAQALQLRDEAIRLHNERSDHAANLERAIELLRVAVERFALDPQAREEWGFTQYCLGLAFADRVHGRRRENLLSAVGHYRAAYGVLSFETNAERFAMVRQNLGAVLSDLADVDPMNLVYQEAAIQAGREAMAAHARRNNPIDWAAAAGNLGLACYKAMLGPRAERMEEAINLHEAALAVFTAGAVGVNEALALHRPDNPHWNRSLVLLATQTRTSLQQGSESYTRVSFIRDRAITLMLLSNDFSARLRGDPAQNIEMSISASLDALQLFIELRELPDQARVANNLGHAYLQRILDTTHRNWERSVFYYRHALALHRQISSPFEISQTEQNLAVTLLNRAASLTERSAAERSAEIEEAIDLFRSALHVRTREQFPFYRAMTGSMLGLALLHRLEGDGAANLAEAVALLEEAANMNELRRGAPQKWLEVTANLGLAYVRQERFERAVECFSEAIAGFDATERFDESLDSRIGLTDCLVGLGRKAEAIALLRASIEQLRTLRVSSEWHQTKHRRAVQSSRFIDRLVELSWESSPGEALEWSELGRARALAEVQTGRRRPVHVDQERFDEYLRLQKAQLDLEQTLSTIPDMHPMRAGLLERIREARTQYRSLEATFRYVDPTWSPAVVPLKLHEMIETAPLSNAAILVIRVGVNATYAWLLGTDRQVRARRFESSSRETIWHSLVGSEGDRESSWIGAYFAAKERRAGAFASWLETMNRCLSDLWVNLVAGLHDFVRESLTEPDARLIIVPSQSLGLLPLHAAWRSVDDGPRYWCDDFTIGYAPSIAALRATQTKPPATSPATLFAIANPNADLDWADIEVDHLVKCFPGEATIVRVAEATAARVLAELERRPRIVLFSCHGAWDVADPWRGSGIGLADAALTLRDLSALDFSECQFAMLSACESGMSDAGDPADEYVGLPATFLAGGASTVIVTLWSVEDVATALLTTRAFSQIDPQQPLNALSRLHAAQKWIRTANLAQLCEAIEKLDAPPHLKERAIRTLKRRGDRPCAHPFWWAALTCVGAPRVEATNDGGPTAAVVTTINRTHTSYTRPPEPPSPT